jgi:N-acetylneuraminic acid mutarotase
MATPRSGHQAVLLLDGRVLVVGGPIETISPSNSAELYDPGTGTWAATGSMLAPRFQYTATLLPDGKVLVAGGVNNVVLAGGTNDGPLVSAELYDPVSGTWAATGAMETARYDHTATLLRDGKVLVAAGIVAGDVSDDQMPFSELYDPVSGTWTATGAMAADHFGHTATLLPNGKVLVAGGYQDASPDRPSAELYDPTSGTWTAAGAMATMRSSHTATLLPNGKVLVAGGYIHSTRELCGQPSRSNIDCMNPLTSAELYDPQSGAWSATQGMVSPRAAHTATLLPDGRVLVAGGGGSAEVSACQCHAPVGSAELYDPASETWSATASMIAVRRNHTATLLPDGRVLVASGNGLEIGIGSVDLGSAELYDPGSGN